MTVESPLGAIATLVEAARQSLLLLLRNRLFWLLLLGEVVAAIVAFGIAGSDRHRLDGHDLFCLLAWWFECWVVLPWATMYLTVHAIHAEIEDRTFQYLFLRPVARAPLLLGKWLAAALAATLLVGFGVLVLHVGVAGHPEIWTDGVERESLVAFLGLAGLGSLAYAACGCWFAATFRRPLVWAAIYVVGQMISALLPVSSGVRALTVSDPLRRQLLSWVEPDAQLEQILWPTDRALRDDAVGSPVLALLLLALCLLALALFSYCRAEYDSRERE
ncbi:MAG: ABC transporter permease [Planctomycetes bacterium]|nr:ABC transporter permease [Planctomycetota bacterium]